MSAATIFGVGESNLHGTSAREAQYFTVLDDAMFGCFKRVWIYLWSLAIGVPLVTVRAISAIFPGESGCAGAGGTTPRYKREELKQKPLGGQARLIG
jgi:hypothetical protein